NVSIDVKVCVADTATSRLGHYSHQGGIGESRLMSFGDVGGRRVCHRVDEQAPRLMLSDQPFEQADGLRVVKIGNPERLPFRRGQEDRLIRKAELLRRSQD